MSDRPDDQHKDRRQDGAPEGGSVSEGGSGSINRETATGGADSVPDTPDINTPISDEVDTSEQGDARQGDRGEA